jgi:hypothetical protein
MTYSRVTDFYPTKFPVLTHFNTSKFQNHDTSLRTNLEMVRVLKWLNGSNDVEITQIPGGRVDESLDWSFAALNLFQNSEY